MRKRGGETRTTAGQALPLLAQRRRVPLASKHPGPSTMVDKTPSHAVHSAPLSPSIREKPRLKACFGSSHRDRLTLTIQPTPHAPRRRRASHEACAATYHAIGQGETKADKTTHFSSLASQTVEKWPKPSLRTITYRPLLKVSLMRTGWYPPGR